MNKGQFYEINLLCSLQVTNEKTKCVYCCGKLVSKIPQMYFQLSCYAVICKDYLVPAESDGSNKYDITTYVSRGADSKTF